MRILKNNDEGIHSRVLKILVESISGSGDVFTVVPEMEQSGASHSMTLHEPLRIRRFEKNVYAVNGTPTDCVRLGVILIMKGKADLVISGINAGANLGDDTGYSGTVGGAMEGCMLGIPSFAVSLVLKGGYNYESAGRFAAGIAGRLKKNKLPKKTYLNINVPDLPYEKIRGTAITYQGKRIYGRKIRRLSDPKGGIHYWLSAKNVSGRLTPGSDMEAISRRKISITPLSLDFTDYGVLDVLKKWKL